MGQRHKPRIAIVYPGDSAIRKNATADNNRFAPLFSALAERGAHAEPAVYHPYFWQEVYQQLLQVDGVLIWVNPIQDGHDRSVLDAMLKQVADAGIYVSAHPDIILKMGTKEVIYQTRDMGWGTNTHLYETFTQFQQELPVRLASGEARVLKQYRGHSGIGVWKVQVARPIESGVTRLPLDTQVKIHHAERGSYETVIRLSDLFDIFENYFFVDSGKVIDQAYQTRLPEGMIRCYLVHDRVEGFGHQAINALHPAPEGGNPEDAPQPGPRLYHPPTLPEFQALKHKLESEWLPELKTRLNITRDELPVIWDADFLLGEKDPSGDDTYVLCEINVSSVAPFPDSAIVPIAEAIIKRSQSPAPT